MWKTKNMNSKAGRKQDNERFELWRLNFVHLIT